MNQITVKELKKEVNISEIEISRLKGNRSLPHSSRLKEPLLSKESGVLTFEDLKKYIIYTLKFKSYKKKKMELWVSNTNNYLKNNNIDYILKIIITQNKNINIDKEKLINNLTLKVCIEILKQIYPIPNEVKQPYSKEEILNIFMKEEEKIEESNEEKNMLNYHYSNILDYIFDKYSQKKIGYFPLQHPTGNGKTFFLEKFLIKNLKEDFKNLKHKRIIVITNSKVNLNEICRNVASKLNDNKKIEKYVLNLKSMSDIFNDINFLNETIIELEENLEFYKKFPPNFINNFKRELKDSIKLIEQKLGSKIMNGIEDFIPKIKKEIFNYFNQKETKSIILPKFIYKMYPMILEENLNKKIYIMTTDKFLYGYVGRKETNYFHEGEDNLIFIDEIDSTKQNFLKFIRSQRTLCTNNIINVFNERFNSFSSKDNNQLISLIKRLDENNKIIFTEEQLIKINKEKEKLFTLNKEFVDYGKKLRKKFFTMKRYYEQEEPEKIDLWEDEENYFQNNGIKYYVNINERNCLITKDKNKKTFSLNSLIRELFNFCYGYFYFFLVNICNYHRLFFKEKEEIEKEIISHFFFNEETQNQILNEYKNFFLKRISHEKTENYYDVSKEDKIINMKYSCFQIKEVNPDYPFNQKVLIGSQFMYTTPEIMLYKMCQKNLVFGISATANIQSCIGNFDLNFLKTNLKDLYFSLTTKEKEKLKNSLDKINRFEKDIKRELNIFGKTGNMEIGFKNIKELEKKDYTCYKKVITIVDIFADKISGNEKYKENQMMYFKYSCMVFFNFLLEKDSRSLLFISNRLTQINALKEVFSEIKKILINYYKKNDFKIKDMIFKDLDSQILNESFENKEDDENELKKILSPDLKTVLYTTYQSAGTGVNIKCSAENFDKESLIGIDKSIQEEINFPLNYKDIDEIAIENKTHLINFDNSNDSNNKVEMLYYSSLLLDNNALSREHRSFLLKGDIINFTKIYKNKYDYIENSMGKIIQAIGRCNRTKLKIKIRNIYMDEDSFEVAKKFEPRNRLFIEDINFILQEARKKVIEENTPTILTNELILKNYKIERTIEEEFLEKINDFNNKLNFSNDNIYVEKEFNKFYKLVEDYEKFRRFVLKNPTKSNSNIKNPIYFSVKKKISGYSYLRNDDGTIKEFNFDSSNKNVSSSNSRLDEIFKIPLLRKFCIDNIGTFETNDEIILPYIYQAIYKGMLGEVIIKEVFRLYDIKIKNIDFMIRRGIFEKFDDVTETGIWLDYKNYNLEKMDSRDVFNRVIEDSVLRKSDLINSKNKLFIINLISGKRSSRSIAYYKITTLLNNETKECSFEESEVVIVNGILRYIKDKDILEINDILMKKLQKLLGGDNE